MMCGAIADGDEKFNKDLLKERRDMEKMDIKRPALSFPQDDIFLSGSLQAPLSSNLGQQ
jgi:hypothetical protein